MSEHQIPRASIWPNVIFDTTSADGMAAAQAWVTGLVPVCPVAGSSGANSTPTPRNPNQATRVAREHPVFGTILELLPPDPRDRVTFPTLPDGIGTERAGGMTVKPGWSRWVR